MKYVRLCNMSKQKGDMFSINSIAWHSRYDHLRKTLHSIIFNLYGFHGYPLKLARYLYSVKFLNLKGGKVMF